MNEGEQKALLDQVKLYVSATEKKLASIGLPVRVVLLHPQTGWVVSQEELIGLAEKR